MSFTNHYETLEVSPKATQEEIKQAYRRLAKRFHPDTQTEKINSNKIILLNAAYEILSDLESRRFYDRELEQAFSHRRNPTRNQVNYQNYRKNRCTEDLNRQKWLINIYFPINNLISWILQPLDTEIEYLAADIYDDELMAGFQLYLEDCREYLEQARQLFTSQGNPAQLANVAVSLYYCLEQIGDGIEQLEWFTLNYDEYYLHTGQELFRIAYGLRSEAQAAAKAFI